MGKTTMKPKNPLIENFFQAADENDEKFLEALREICKTNKPIASESTTAVKEQSIPYGVVQSSDVDKAPCSVGEAMGKTLEANGWSETDAAHRAGVSGAVMQHLLTEMMPLSTSTVRGVAGFICSEYRLPDETSKLLAEWLLNGLRFWELQHPQDKSGSIRFAARPKELHPDTHLRRKKHK
ncbi:MAG: hypothetical protein V1799_16670 [bacterium]